MSEADWDRLQYYSRKVKFIAMSPDTHGPQVHPSTYIRIAQLQTSVLFPSLRRLHYNLGNNFISHNLGNNFISHIFLFLSPLLDSLELFNIGGFENNIVGPFLATLSSQMLTRIVLHTGRMSADVLKNFIVHSKQLRSLDLTDAVVMSDFSLWEVLGTLPSLEDLTLKAVDSGSHPTHIPVNSNSRSESPKYFEALKALSVTGSFFLIQHLLGFIDSQCLKSINIYPVTNLVRFPEAIMTMVVSKWSQSLKKLVIDSSAFANARRSGCEITTGLMLLTDLHEIQAFHLEGWKMENMDNDVRRLVMSWPNLRILKVIPLNQTSISLSTLRIIAENCPELRYLGVRLDNSTFDTTTSSKSLHHNLEFLDVRVDVRSSSTQTRLECQIQVARNLDLIFPYLKSIEVEPNDDGTWSGIRNLVKLCQEIRRVK